jgi:hypothetical protein
MIVGGGTWMWLTTPKGLVLAKGPGLKAALDIGDPKGALAIFWLNADAWTIDPPPV